MERYKGNIVRYCFGVVVTLCLWCITTFAQAYCSVKGTTSSYEWIAGVNVAGQAFPSANNNGYGNFTAQTIRLAAGANSLLLTPGFSSSAYTEKWTVWVDYNQDTVFGADEAVFSGTSSGSVSGNIVVPATALNGPTRMRVMMQFSGTLQPCVNPTYGEVEDYTVLVENRDTTAPVISSKSPANSASNIKISSAILVQFSEKIDPLSVTNNSISLTRNGVALAGVISVENNLLRFVPDQPFDYSTQYDVVVYAGILDMAGNSLPSNSSWSFTTELPDTTAPSIISRSPDSNEQSVAVNRNVITVWFSEAINPATVNSSSFQLLRNGQPVTGNISFGLNNTQAMLSVAQEHEYATTYTVRVTNGIKDVAGNALRDAGEWNFTTRSPALTYCSSFGQNYSLAWIKKLQIGSLTNTYSSAPGSGYADNTNNSAISLTRGSEYVEITPGFGNGSVPVYVKIFLDINQDGGFSADELAFSGNGSSKISGYMSVSPYALSGNTRLRVSLQYGFPQSACGLLTYGEVKDYTAYLWPITDTQPPVPGALSPANASTNHAIGTPLVVAVSEHLQPASVKNALLLQSGSQVVEVTGVYNAADKKIIFSPVSPLQYGTLYTASLGGLKDIAGNTMAGTSVWSFTTEPQPATGNIALGNVKLFGTNLSGVSVALSGAANAAAVTDSNGNFLFAGLAPGNYVITPAKNDYVFSPSSQTITVTEGTTTQTSFSASAVNGVVANGGFEQGSFNGFIVFTTPNGTLNKTFALSDVDNDGKTSLAADFSVGVKTFTNGTTYGGGGIAHTIGLKPGSLNVSVDISASTSARVSLLLDGQVMDSYDFASPAANTRSYKTLMFNLPEIMGGNHEISVLLTRNYTASGSLSVDDLVVTGTSTQ